MAKQNFEELADKVVDLLGGKKNISYFTHCVTRLRFNVKDKGLVQTSDIEKLPGVIGAQWSGDQYQVIIGQAVGDAYNTIVERHGFEKQDAVDEDLGDAAGTGKKFSFNMILDSIAGSITPLIPLLLGAGMIKVIVLFAQQLGLMAPGSPTDTILSIAGDAGFYFLPVFVGATAARKLGANMGLGMLIGATLMHPSFTALVEGGEALSLFGVPVYPASYAYGIFPVILTVAFMAPVERFFAKHLPEVIRSFAEPLLTLLVTLPVSLCALAPAGAIVGTWLSNGLAWLYQTTGFLGAGIFAAAYPLLVLTGMHVALTPFFIDFFSNGGGDPFMTMGAMISDINQGVACAAASLKLKNKESKSVAASCAVTALAAGVTEPALFGITFRYKTPLYCVLAGNFVGGCIGAIGAVRALALAGASSFWALPVFLGNSAQAIGFLAAGVIAGMVVTFVGTYMFFKPEE